MENENGRSYAFQCLCPVRQQFDIADGVYAVIGKTFNFGDGIVEEWLAEPFVAGIQPAAE